LPMVFSKDIFLLSAYIFLTVIQLLEKRLGSEGQKN